MLLMCTVSGESHGESVLNILSMLDELVYPSLHRNAVELPVCGLRVLAVGGSNYCYCTGVKTSGNYEMRRVVFE